MNTKLSVSAEPVEIVDYVNGLADRIASLETDKAAQIARLEAEVDAVPKSIIESLARNAEQAETIARLEAERKLHLAVNAEQAVKIDRLEAEVQGRERTMLSLRHHRDELKARLQTAEAERDKLKAMRDTLKEATDSWDDGWRVDKVLRDCPAWIASGGLGA